MKRALVLCTLLVLASPADGRAQRPAQARAATDSVQIHRLAALGKLWGYVKYFHPSLAYRTDVDWDKALVDAIPRVRAASTAESFAAAVDSMLRVLGDPATHVVHPAAPSGETTERAFGVRWASGSDRVLVVTAGSYYALFDAAVQEGLRQLADSIPLANAVVFDLRSHTAADAYARVQLTGSFDYAQRLLTTEPLVTPGTRRRVYYGFESPGPFSSGQYRTGLFTRNGARITPAKNARHVRAIFLLDANAELLPAAIPLQAAGRALIVYEGDPRVRTQGEAHVMSLGDGLTARVRLSEQVFADGTNAELEPDLIVNARASSEADVALDRAIALAADFRASTVRRDRLPATAAAPLERVVPTSYPDEPDRLLGAFRLWSAVEHFYPYRDLLDHDWSDVLAESIPAFLAASDAREYTLAVVGMAERIQDSHAYVGGRVYAEDLVGTGYPPIRVRLVEGKPVVTRIFDSAAGARAGIRVGDVVVRVDGENAGRRFEAARRLLSTSTPQSRDDRAALGFMNGSPGSTVRLTLRGASGAEREATLERRREDFTTLYHRERDGDVVRMLPDSVGYVDLDRLAYDMVDSMFARLRHARGIVFDMRGYPNGTVWAIAPRLTDSAKVAALIETPLIGHSSPGPAVETFRQTFEPAAAAARYRGPTVMLIDERTVSQAEHTGLYLRAANGTRFVGTATAGADGEITTVSLPGGITVGFTGQAVRHPDGRQLQRIGLQPDVEVRPTIAGIRAGRDEVLEAAVKLLGRSRGQTR